MVTTYFRICGHLMSVLFCSDNYEKKYFSTTKKRPTTKNQKLGLTQRLSEMSLPPLEGESLKYRRCEELSNSICEPKCCAVSLLIKLQ